MLYKNAVHLHSDLQPGKVHCTTWTKRLNLAPQSDDSVTSGLQNNQVWH